MCKTNRKVQISEFGDNFMENFQFLTNISMLTLVFLSQLKRDNEVISKATCNKNQTRSSYPVLTGQMIGFKFIRLCLHDNGATTVLIKGSFITGRFCINFIFQLMSRALRGREFPNETSLKSGLLGFEIHILSSFYTFILVKTFLTC